MEVDKWVRAHNKKLLVADTRGLFGMIFVDFGPAHIIEDDNGEPCQEVLIEHVDKLSGDVTCLEDTRHGFQDGDYVRFSEVVGMTELNNALPRKITVKNPCKFNIGDVSKFSDYVEGGKAKQVKMPSRMALAVTVVLIDLHLVPMETVVEFFEYP
ncbi:unnamed protein product [Soboliphyme baturini]|uniref:E1_FCCH domain-containing protein n=1 Tax=Soboliphyme baturini TaxID=241478 RepID=A0A183J9R9_9BILA|nr:unnamed protein product [Soboliphyme baturini]